MQVEGAVWGSGFFWGVRGLDSLPSSRLLARTENIGSLPGCRLRGLGVHGPVADFLGLAVSCSSSKALCFCCGGSCFRDLVDTCIALMAKISCGKHSVKIWEFLSVAVRSDPKL